MLTTMDGEDFPSPVNSDAVKNTSHKIDPLDDKKNSPGKKRASRRTKKKENKEVRAKIRDTKKEYTR